MRLTCSAMGCKVRTGLQGVQIPTPYLKGGLLDLPETVVIHLCPKHFIIRK